MMQEASEKTHPEQTLIDLCATFISANGVKPEFYYPAAKNLLKDGLISLDIKEGLIICAEESKLKSFLVNYGYPRGEYVAGLVASRIHRSIDQINQQGGVSFLEDLQNSDLEKVTQMLSPLYGVGPKFINLYATLAGVSIN